MNFNMDLSITIREIESFEEFLNQGYQFKGCCFQNINFQKAGINWKSVQIENCIFLGCAIDNEDVGHILGSGSLIFPKVKGIPYNVYRSGLYTWEELYKINESHGITIDEIIYHHFSSNKHNGNITEYLYQRIHDHSIDDALYDLLVPQNDGSYEKKCVGIMGGHSVLRSDENYKNIVRIAHGLAQEGSFICSGGGPGIMEAANLGAYMADYSKDELEEAIDLIHSHLTYIDHGYHEQALQVLERYSIGADNLAIPTWFYGHEPSNVFASHIAKYFSNSIREDTLLAISLHGIIFAPGSAGTIQEIFMDAAQNHYGTFDYFSPMVFLGKEHYIRNTGIYPLLQKLSKGKEYGNLLYISDQPDDIIAYFRVHQPVKTK